VAERANEARAAAKAEAVQQQERDEQGRFGPSVGIHDAETRRDWSEVNARRSSTRLGAEIGVGRIAPSGRQSQVVTAVNDRLAM
jgi:hypothetical protein